MSEVEVNDRDVTLLILSFFGLIVTVGLLVFNVVFLVGQAHKGDQVYGAVCLFKENLQQQIFDSEHYLATHPNGAPSLGLSAASIQQSIDREKVSVDALSSLNCSNG